MLDGPRQVQVISRAAADGDAHARSVDVGDLLQGRVLGHHVGALDEHVRRGEVDLGGAHRLDGDEGDVPGTGFESLEYLAGRLEGDELERKAGAASELSG